MLFLKKIAIRFEKLFWVVFYCYVSFLFLGQMQLKHGNDAVFFGFLFIISVSFLLKALYVYI